MSPLTQINSILTTRKSNNKTTKHKKLRFDEMDKPPHTNFDQKLCTNSGLIESPIDLVHPWRISPSAGAAIIGGGQQGEVLPGHYSFSHDGTDYPHTLLRGNVWFGRSRDSFYAILKNNQIIYEFVHGSVQTSEMTIRGENWDDEYIVAFGRITWGMENHRGSEHTINGKRFPMEFQITHYRKSDGNYKTALNNKGVIIVAVLVELSGIDNPQIEPLIHGATTTSNHHFILRGDNRVHGPINLKKIITGDHNIAMNYFEYEGSNTIPPCKGGVKWIVFDQPTTVSDRQMNNLRRYGTDLHNKPLGDNFRPIQPLGHRTVKYYGNTFKIIEEEIPLSYASKIFKNTILILILTIFILTQKYII